MKKLLAVCFCLLVTASMAMSDTLVLQGTWDGIDYTVYEDAVSNYFGKPADEGWFDFFPMDASALASPGFDPLWDRDDFTDPMWDGIYPTEWTHILIVSASEWYLFADTELDGLLTTPAVGENTLFGIFNGQGLSFDYYALYSNESSPNVPEPGTLVLLGTGIAGLAFAARRRTVKK